MFDRSTPTVDGVNMAETMTKITIHRTIDLEVEVGHVPGQGPRFYPEDLGEPEEFWIESAVDAETGEPVELQPSEIETAITKAIRDRKEGIEP